MSYGQQIIDAIVSGRLCKIENVYPDGDSPEFDTHNHLIIWGNHASEQLDALVDDFIVAALERPQTQTASKGGTP